MVREHWQNRLEERFLKSLVSRAKRAYRKINDPGPDITSGPQNLAGADVQRGAGPKPAEPAHKRIGSQWRERPSRDPRLPQPTNEPQSLDLTLLPHLRGGVPGLRDNPLRARTRGQEPEGQEPGGNGDGAEDTTKGFWSDFRDHFQGPRSQFRSWNEKRRKRLERSQRPQRQQRTKTTGSDQSNTEDERETNNPVQEKSTWSKGAKRRYDRCLKKITESRDNPYTTPGIQSGTVSVRRGDPHAHLSNELRMKILARKALLGGGAKELARNIDRSGGPKK